MLVDIPDELLEELAQALGRVQKLSHRSSSNGYWSAVSDQEVATYPILDIIHDAARGKLPKHSCKTAKPKN